MQCWARAIVTWRHRGVSIPVVWSRCHTFVPEMQPWPPVCANNASDGSKNSLPVWGEFAESLSKNLGTFSESSANAAVSGAHLGGRVESWTLCTCCTVGASLQLVSFVPDNVSIDTDTNTRTHLSLSATAHYLTQVADKNPFNLTSCHIYKIRLKQTVLVEYSSFSSICFFSQMMKLSHWIREVFRHWTDL